MADFRPGGVDYDGPMSRHFDAGRGLLPASEEIWRKVVLEVLADAPPARVLDLGAGTGRFSTLLAGWLDADVVAVEPAQGMREAAARAGRHPRVSLLGGRAEAVPLRDASAGAAWLSNVIHHVGDRRACAAELRRVLGPAPRLLLRGGFGGRLDEISLFRYFPEARAVAEQFPGVAQLASDFGSAGFELAEVRRVYQPSCASVREMARRTRLRADSTLALLPDATFRRGQAAIERAARRERVPQPVIDGVDLLVFAA